MMENLLEQLEPQYLKFYLNKIYQMYQQQLQDILVEFYWGQEVWLEHILGATLEGLKETEYVEKTVGYESKVETSYKDLEQIKYELEKNKIKTVKTEYKENIELLLEIPEEKMEFVKALNVKIQNSTKKYVEI